MIFSRESKDQSLLGVRGPARRCAGFSVFVLNEGWEWVGSDLPPRARFLERYGFLSDRSTYNKAKAAQKSVVDAYNLAKQNGDIKKLSRYASTKPEEFFAECFAAREDGEKLPSYINKMFDKVIKLGTVRA